MLVYGTANPVGLNEQDYNGVYLTSEDVDQFIPAIVGCPVLIEHQGGPVGKVVTAWKHEGRMDLMLEIDEKSLQGVFGRQFVETGRCKELSLGYNMQMTRGEDGKLSAKNKKVVEVSLVRKGAREDCHIRGWGVRHLVHV